LQAPPEKRMIEPHVSWRFLDILPANQKMQDKKSNRTNAKFETNPDIQAY
jgi:hypothetical protein